MSNMFFSHVLDDPYYIGNGEYLSVITTGKVRVEGEAVRDFNKDAAAKAGLLRVNTKTKQTTFIDFNKHSEVGDRYRCVEVIDGVAYIMRTQKKHVDSVVRIATVNLATNEVSMIEEKAVNIHGTETPKTFCGHFNFGRPIVVGKKIIYPPLNSGVVIVFDTETHVFTAHDVPDDTASIWCTYVPELNEVIFFPYGNRTNKLLVLNLTTNEHKFIEAPVSSTFYNAFSHKGKAIGVPLTMGNSASNMHFWVYDGKTIEAFEYSPTDTETNTGMMGFKYGVELNNIYYTHTIWNKGNELVKFDLINKTVETVRTDMPLGCKPYATDDGVFLFPGIQAPSMADAPASVFKVEGSKLVEEFKLPTNNLTYGPINSSDKTILFVPYRYNLNTENKLSSVLTIVDLEKKSAETVSIELELE